MQASDKSDERWVLEIEVYFSNIARSLKTLIVALIKGLNEAIRGLLTRSPMHTREEGRKESGTSYAVVFCVCLISHP